MASDFRLRSPRRRRRRNALLGWKDLRIWLYSSLLRFTFNSIQNRPENWDSVSTFTAAPPAMGTIVYAGSAIHAGNTIREVISQVTVGRESLVLHHFTMQLDWSVCPLIILTSTLVLHIFSPILVILVFNELYKEGKLPRMKSYCCWCIFNRSLWVDSETRRKWMQFNQVELLAVYFPVFFVSIPFCLGVIILLEPKLLCPIWS